MFRYFTLEDVERISEYEAFYIPREFFTNPKYAKLNSKAKTLYGLLLDRTKLSRQNNWVDEKGNIYIHFSDKEATEILKCGVGAVRRAFKQLKGLELIEEVSIAGKSNVIYLKEANWQTNF